MNSPEAEISRSKYNVVSPALHTLHECSTAGDFMAQFEAGTKCPIENIADALIAPSAPKAVFAVGSIPLGMGSSGSDVDLIVLVDSRTALRNTNNSSTNTDQRLEFSSESDPLLAAEVLALHQGILVDLQVAITPAIHDVYQRLRRKGPDISETEIRTLGRLSSGWLLWQSEGYLERNSVVLNDPALGVYCSTKCFVSALLQRRKAARAMDVQDIPLALQHGRSSVEAAYLAYFASEGLPYLGSKWLAQIGHARGARERVARHPLLTQGLTLLFPTLGWSAGESTRYLRDVSEFLSAMRNLIEQRLLFKIAFKACPQIEST